MLQNSLQALLELRKVVRLGQELSKLFRVCLNLVEEILLLGRIVCAMNEAFELLESEQHLDEDFVRILSVGCIEKRRLLVLALLQQVIEATSKQLRIFSVEHFNVLLRQYSIAIFEHRNDFFRN